MQDESISRAIQKLQSLAAETHDPDLRAAVEVLGDVISVGNISQATGVAIGRNIRMVVNQLNLPAETVGALLEVRSSLEAALGLDPDRYRLDDLLADKTRDFTGRAYVFAAFEAFLQANPNGYFVIEADPGLGKSAILAEYLRRTGCLAHFNVRALGINTARQFLESVCAQLIVDFGLPYASLPPQANQDGVFLTKLLKEASARLEPGERLVIAVDALDEVDLTNHPDGANILYLPANLPERVYFLLSRRQVDLPFVVQAPHVRLDLMAYPAENRQDVEHYLHVYSRRPGLQAWIERQRLSPAAFVRKLADLSENNFMYLRYVLLEIETGAYQDLEVHRLPAGLQGYYEDHWRSMGMTAKPLPRVKIRIIYVLCEIRQPVGRPTIARFASDASMTVDELSVQEVLDEWDQFLHEQPGPPETRYSIYHASFRDFLQRKDVVQAAGVTLPEINALIADSLWGDLFGESGDE
jgi:hypothetical protein